MIRVLLTAVILAMLPLASRAGETVIRLNVRPMAAPKPALKYQLLPELWELNPGNPAQNYLKCFAEQRNFYFNKEANEERARYLTMPLDKLPAKDLYGYGGSSMRQADWAARLDTLDWQVLQKVQTEGMDLSLPELKLLQLLAPGDPGTVSGRSVSDAGSMMQVRTAKTMLALARHLGEYPIESGHVLGLSVAHQCLDTLEEMLQQPGCPNLYWALTDLPSPLVDLRKGIQGERALITADLRTLRDDAPMTEEQLERFISRLSGWMGFAREQAGQAPRSLRTGLSTRAKDADRLRAARARLVEAGRKEGLVQKLPPAQVILLDEKHEYEVRRDESMKLLALAPWQIDALTNGNGGGHRGDGLFADVLPNIVGNRREQGRLEQRIAFLRHIEALRLYAAEHECRLPQKLADISLPLPPDPFTGKPFVYKVEGTTVHLSGSPPRGEELNACFNVRYEINMQK